MKPAYPAMEICKGGGIRPDTIHGNPTIEGYVEQAMIAGYSGSILIQAIYEYSGLLGGMDSSSIRNSVYFGGRIRLTALDVGNINLPSAGTPGKPLNLQLYWALLHSPILSRWYL